MNITIQSLVVNVTIAGAASPKTQLAEAIGSAFAKAAAEAAVKTTASAGESTIRGLSSDDIEKTIVGLGGSVTLDLLKEHYDGVPAEVVEHLVGCMVHANLLATVEDEGTTYYTLPVPTGAGVGANPEDDIDEATPPADTAAAPASARPSLTFDNVLTFLRSDPRYTLRTGKAIAEHFDHADTVPVVNVMVHDGLVGTKRQRGTGDVLFFAIAPAPVADAAPVAETAAAATCSGDEAPEPPAPTMDAITAFLHSDPRYKLRPLEAIAEQFFDTSYNRVEELLDSMADMGLVSTKRRRADGATLYFSAVAAPTLTTASDAPATAWDEVAVPALTETNIRSFIQSDDRYTQRSVASIAKHFGDTSVGVSHKLEDMADAGDLRRTTRRSDGAALYSVA